MQAGTFNSFIENIVYDPSSTPPNPNMFEVGTGFEVRLAPTGNPIYRGALFFGDGSEKAPIIARETQADTGLYFRDNFTGVSVAGENRISANALGVAFNGATPVARQTYGVPSGNAGANRETFNPDTVGVRDLAYRVKALIMDLQARGDLGSK